MAAYEYTALDAAGREHRGVLDGDSARQVRQLLRDQSLLPVVVNEPANVSVENSDMQPLELPPLWFTTLLKAKR